MPIVRALLLFAFAAASEAAVLYYSDYDLTRAQNVLLRLEASPGNAQEVTESAGVMSIQVDGGPTLDAFCADVFTGIAGNNSYTSTVFSTNSAPYTRVAWLIANVLPTIVSGSGTAQQQGAALQVAIWDVIHDNGDGLDAGVLQKAALTDAGVIAYVNSYLASPWSPTAGLNLYQNVFPGTSIAAQDLVSLSSSVPEPSTGALLAGAVLAALALAGRKHYSL